jgi:hypothetical protein
MFAHVSVKQMGRMGRKKLGAAVPRPILSRASRKMGAVDAVQEDQSFTVVLSTNDDIRAARASLIDGVRRFASKVVGWEVRLVWVTQCFTRDKFAEWLTRYVTMIIFHRPNDPRPYDEILSEVQSKHGAAIEGFIDENIVLIGDLKFGT